MHFLKNIHEQLFILTKKDFNILYGYPFKDLKSINKELF